MNQMTLPIAELKPALTGLGKIISRSATLPVLRMIKIERTKDGWVTLTGTDLETFVTVRLEQPLEGEPVVILVEHEDLQRIAKRCGQDESIIIEKQSDEKSLVTLPIGNQTTVESLASLPPEEFPIVPRIKTDPVSLTNEIRQSLLEAFECASHDETRQILHGAFIDVSNQKCQQVVSTDGRHLYGSFALSLPLRALLARSKSAAGGGASSAGKSRAIIRTGVKWFHKRVTSKQRCNCHPELRNHSSDLFQRFRAAIK